MRDNSHRLRFFGGQLQGRMATPQLVVRDFVLVPFRR